MTEGMWAMKPCRMGVMRFPADHVAFAGCDIECEYCNSHYWVGNDTMKRKLNLPLDAKIEVSPHVGFMTNEVTVRIEHPSLPVTAEACQLPKVEPEWDVGHFVGWKVVK